MPAKTTMVTTASATMVAPAKAMMAIPLITANTQLVLVKEMVLAKTTILLGQKWH